MNKMIYVYILLLLIGVGTAYSTGIVKERDSNLAKVIQPLKQEGFSIDKNRSVQGVLNKGAIFDYMLVLYGDSEYVIVAAGDETTKNIDIEVYDEDEKLIKKDKSHKATAMIKFVPEWTGAFYVKVIMRDCTGAKANYISLYGNKE